jgi:tripartite motif-containing protein 71
LGYGLRLPALQLTSLFSPSTSRLPARRLFGAVGLVALLASALMLAVAARASATTCPGSTNSSCSVTGAYGNTSKLGYGDQGQNVLRQPQAVDLAGGNVLVGDRWGWQVQKFATTDHAFVGRWGEYGAASGQFTAIGGVTHDSSGNVYVLDIANNRVEKFDSSNAFQTAWGSDGCNPANPSTGDPAKTGPTSFCINFKGGVAWGPGRDSAGNAVSGGVIYVSDSYRHRVVEFDTSGSPIRQIGVTDVFGSDSSHLYYPQGVTVDGSGNVYVADDRNDRIQKFTDLGAYAATIGSSGSGGGQLNNPYDVGLDATCDVYVADNLNNRVDKFAPSSGGCAATAYNTASPANWGAGVLDHPRALAVDGAGNQYVADTVSDQMREFDSSGSQVTTSGSNPWGEGGRSGGELTGPEGLDLDQSANLTIADTLEYRVQELKSSDGSFVTYWGDHVGFQLPADVAVASDGTIYVADTNHDKVQVFSSPDNHQRDITGFKTPRGVALDSAGNLYVADTGNNRVQKVSPGATSGTTFGSGATLSQPGDVAVSRSNGDVYVADTANNRIVEFDSTGALVRTWGVTGGNASQPSGIDVDGAGSVYVADPGNALVHKYGPTGTSLLSWGARGHGVGEFWLNGPNDVTADGSGNVYVSDTYGNRVEAFSGVGFSTPPPASPGSIAGTVKDVATGASISKANVACGSYSAKTNSSGSYSIPSVPAGTYTCTATKSRYNPSSQQVTVASGATTTANFSLTHR